LLCRYIETFESGFSDLKDVQLSFMQSDGGLAPTNRFSGHRAVLSGPAGGYVGYALTTKWHGYNAEKLQLIGFDMGGTSTDVSRFAGSYEHVFEATLAGRLPLHTILTAQAPLFLLFVTCVKDHKGNFSTMSSFCLFGMHDLLW
jgi:N-methylhydantoinase A/oxoprolinase/acetone carboxylase beta subunit